MKLETIGQKHIRISVFKETEDNWYPPHELVTDARYKYLVEVSYVELDNGEWRVCCWGKDDLGLEIDFGQHERMKAWEVFIKILEQKYVSIDFCKSLGMVEA